MLKILYRSQMTGARNRISRIISQPSVTVLKDTRFSVRISRCKRIKNKNEYILSQKHFLRRKEMRVQKILWKKRFNYSKLLFFQTQCFFKWVIQVFQEICGKSRSCDFYTFRLSDVKIKMSIIFTNDAVTHPKLNESSYWSANNNHVKI